MENIIRNKRLCIFAFFAIISFGLAQCVPITTIIPTNTPENTATQTFTATTTQSPTATQTPTAPPTFTPLPTLNPEEEQATVLTLLESNGGCALPCWWGITPGTTTKSDAEHIIRELNLDFIEYIPGKMGTGWSGIEKEFLLHFLDGILEELIDIKIQNDYVKFIRINSAFLSNTVTSSPTFNNALAAFTPEKIIPALGIPSRVLIDPAFGPGEGTTTYIQYTLYVLYDQKGVRLQYTIIDDLNNKFKICPTFGNGGNTEDSFGILLASPNDNVPIETYDESDIQENRAIPIEKAAGITPEEFYNLFTQTEKPICFNVLSSVLP